MPCRSLHRLKGAWHAISSGFLIFLLFKQVRRRSYTHTGMSRSSSSIQQSNYKTCMAKKKQSHPSLGYIACFPQSIHSTFLEKVVLFSKT